jgi:hypothetical protein
MNEDALRVLVRETIARLQSREASGEVDAASLPAPDFSHASSLAHASHYQYALPPSGGPCLIEPGVPCNHCGYCQSHGH